MEDEGEVCAVVLLVRRWSSVEESESREELSYVACWLRRDRSTESEPGVALLSADTE